MATKKQYDELLGELKKSPLTKDKKIVDHGITFGQLLFYEKYKIRIPKYIYRRLEMHYIKVTFLISLIITAFILLLILLSELILQRLQLSLKGFVNEYFVFPYLAVLLLFLFVLTIVFLFPKQRSE